MLLRRLSNETILNSKSLPRSASRFLTGRTSTCEPGKERADSADVDREAALDAIEHAALDRLVGLERLFDLVPDAHARGLLARHERVARRAFEALDVDIDLVAALQL